MSVTDLIVPALPFPTAPAVDVGAPVLLLTGPRAFWLAGARRFARDALEAAAVPAETRETVLLALEEVVVEALRQNGSRSVTVEVGLDAETIEVVVRERGATSGFDASCLTGLDRHAHEWGVARRFGSSQSWFRVRCDRHPMYMRVP